MEAHEFDKSSHIPSLDVVATAYTDIVKHNDKHTGMGAALMNMFRGALEEDTFGEAPDQDSIDRNVIEGDMDADLQEMLYAETFERIGVRIISSGDTMLNGSGEQTTSTKLIPLITNTELYKEFLENTAPDEIEVGQNTKLFTDVLQTSRRIIVLGFNEREAVPSSEAQDAAKQVLRTFVGIEPEYRRLGLDASSLREAFPKRPEKSQTFRDEHDKTPVFLANRAFEQARSGAEVFESLERFIDYWGKDLLSEHIAFGVPARYEAQRLAYFDGLQNLLEEEVDKVLDIPESDRTYDFKKEMATALLLSLEKSLKDMDERPDDWFASDENRELLETNISRLKALFDSES